MNLMLEENPMYGFNPRRKRRRSRSRRNPLSNPVKALSLERWTGGIDYKEMGAAVGGLAATTMIPRRVYASFRGGATAPVTLSDKLIWLAISFGTALGAGYVGRQLGAGAGRAALLGGLAGTGVDALKQIAGVTIASDGNAAVGGRVMRQLGAGIPVPPAPMRTREETQLIVP